MKEKQFNFLKDSKSIYIYIAIICIVVVIMLLVLPTKDVSLPNVVGLNKEKAKEVIRDAGLKFKISGEEYNTDVEKDSVIYQNPTYLEKYDNVKKGSTVEVVISKGAER